MALKSKRDKRRADRIRHGEVWGIVLIGLSALLLLSLYYYRSENNPLMNTGTGASSGNYMGKVGAYIAFGFLFVFGLSAYVLPVFSLVFGLLLIIRRPPEKMWLKILLLAILVITASCILSIQTGLPLDKWFPYLHPDKGIGYGGMLGQQIGQGLLVTNLGRIGSSVVLIVGFLASLMLITEVEIYPYLAFFGRLGMSALSFMGEKSKESWQSFRESRREGKKEKKSGKALGKASRKASRRRKAARDDEDDEEAEEVVRGRGFGRKKPIEPKPIDDTPIVRKIVVPETIKVKAKPKESKPSPAMKMEYGSYELPPTDLLRIPEKVDDSAVFEDINRNSEILEQTLLNFGVEAKIGEIHKGPVITRYEVHLAPGIKVNRITALSDDIALAMKAPRVRIVAPIPGKGAVGIEIPNKQANMVCLREVLESKEIIETKAGIPIALGKSIDGQVVVGDLADMPHLLIAGATGSGKSVCINSAIMSMLFTLRPDQVKFIMVDPKKIELSMYNCLPHLLVPVITDAKKVANGLNWLTLEMEKRYDYLAKAGARNIEAYNARPIVREETETEGEAQQSTIPDRLPYIVAIIDELADLMMVSPQDVENAITRLAQLSRAVGIHLIIATQRPSVNVITGVIKANLPARVSFQVASKVDSRTVLDQNGAEKLIGNGDALMLPPGTSRLVRLQGTYVSDDEMREVLDFISKQAEPEFDHSILEKQDKGGDSGPGEDFDDELFDDAVEITLLTGQASASNLQRRLRIGYARAARIIDMMEDRGVIGPARGSKPRDILVKQEDEDEYDE